MALFMIAEDEGALQTPSIPVHKAWGDVTQRTVSVWQASPDQPPGVLSVPRASQRNALAFYRTVLFSENVQERVKGIHTGVCTGHFTWRRNVARWETALLTDIIIIIINYPLTARVLHFSLSSTALWDLPNSGPVHSLMLSSHLFLCLPCLPPPFTVPCKMVLARPDERETRPYHCSGIRYEKHRRQSLFSGQWMLLVYNS